MPVLGSLLHPTFPPSAGLSLFMTETVFRIFFAFFNPMPSLNFLIVSKKSAFPFMRQSFTYDKYVSPPILSALIKFSTTFSVSFFPGAIYLYISNIYNMGKNQMKIKIFLDVFSAWK